MLPFLKNMRERGAMAGPMPGCEMMDEGGEVEDAEKALKYLCHDFLSAIRRDDPEEIGRTLKAIFLSFDSEPHVEGPNNLDLI